MSFNLPDEPVNGHEVHYWRFDHRNKIVRCRAVYHVNTPWGDAEQTEQLTGDGAAFKDQWQNFRRGEFIGRTDGWARMEGLVHNSDVCFSMEDAIQEQRRRYVAERKALTRKVIEIMERLEEIETE